MGEVLPIVQVFHDGFVDGDTVGLFSQQWFSPLAIENSKPRDRLIHPLQAGSLHPVHGLITRSAIACLANVLWAVHETARDQYVIPLGEDVISRSNVRGVHVYLNLVFRSAITNGW
ncbi:hypothetical protein D3C72_1247640 [compost metagenome]